MNSTRQNGEKGGYRIILLLVVALTAFSSAMKELNQLQQFTLDASRLIAQWSDKFTPAEDPAAPLTVEVLKAVVKTETCDLKQSQPSVELPWLSDSAPSKSPAPRAVVPRPSQVEVAKNLPKPTDFQLAKAKKFHRLEVDPGSFDFTITTDVGPENVFTSEFSSTHFKTRTRKGRELKIDTRDREVFLKSLNRSISLRFAS